MKQLKKTTSLFLILITVASLCIGCSDVNDIKEIVDTNENITANNTSNDTSGDTETPTPTPAPAPASKETMIEEQILLDSNGVVITAKEYKKDSIWGDGIKLLIENNSDKDINVRCNAVIVNNYMINELFYASVAAGKKSNETLYLSSTELEQAGISNIAQIEVYFYLYDSNTYDRIYEADKVTIKTSLYDEMDTNANTDGVELYNKNGIKILGKYVDEDSFWGASALLYIENNSGKNITVSVDDVSVNGFMVSSLLSSTVYNGKKALCDVTFLSSDLEENDIETIETIELSFRIYDPDTYNTIEETEPISFNVKS